ncbi:MAG: MAPEG family protein [Pseudomonadota bacterium]
MTTDLWMLVATAMLCVGTTFVYGAGRFMQPGGAAWAAGNREREFAVPGWVARAVKVHANLVENIAPFAVLVLVAHVSGKASASTALGASIFFWCRLAHLAVYVAGWRHVRSLLWFASWGGASLILLALFK